MSGESAVRIRGLLITPMTNEHQIGRLGHIESEGQKRTSNGVASSSMHPWSRKTIRCSSREQKRRLRVVTIMDVPLLATGKFSRLLQHARGQLYASAGSGMAEANHEDAAVLNSLLAYQRVHRAISELGRPAQDNRSLGLSCHLGSVLAMCPSQSVSAR